MKSDADFRKTFSFFRILVTWLPLQFPWCSFFVLFNIYVIFMKYSH